MGVCVLLVYFSDRLDFNSQMGDSITRCGQWQGGGVYSSSSSSSLIRNDFRNFRS